MADLPIAGTLRAALLPLADNVRAIPGAFGVRYFGVSVVVQSWAGERAGMGAMTEIVKAVYTSQGKWSPKVRQLSQRAIMESGGVYQDQDIEVGPITPPFQADAGNNSDIAIWDPALASVPTEVRFLVTGPGYGPSGAYFKIVGRGVDRSFRYTFVLRKTGETPTP